MQESTKPLAAVAAVASHRLLSIATQAFATAQFHQKTAEGSDTLALMLSALTAVKFLTAARVPMLDAPVAANIVELLHQLLDKVKLSLSDLCLRQSVCML